VSRGWSALRLVVDHQFSTRIELLSHGDRVTLVVVALGRVGDDFAVLSDELPFELSCFVLVDVNFHSLANH
jgi:hypothetical protein